MRNFEDCIYLNDIKGCKVTHIYECHQEFIEIQYLKDSIQKSLVIEFYMYGGSMGYGSFFKYSGVELPQWSIKNDRFDTKVISERLVGIRSIIKINCYKKASYGYGDTEELEILYLNYQGEKESYLLDYLSEEDDWFAPRIRKNALPKYEKLECSDESFPSELFSTRVYKESLAFALKAHGDQKTPSDLPYSFHICSVALEIINSLSQHRISYEEANVAIACALLHDVLEDTETSLGINSIDIPNVEIVLQGVWALTKKEDLPTKAEQMQDSLKRLQEMPKCVQMVKLADRITNLAPAPIFWNRAKREAYVNEAKLILEALKGSNPYLEKKLLKKIENYDVEGAHRALGGELIADNYLAFYGRAGEYHTEKIQLILDKNHPKYLKTFKAINRLNEYVYEKYEINLFRQRIKSDTFTNMPTIDGLAEHKRVGLKYIVNTLNTKDLLNLNKQVDIKIDKYMTTIYDGEDCFIV